MEDIVKNEAKDFVITGIEKSSGQFGINVEVSRDPALSVLQQACKFIKEQMDRQFGPDWHCIIGEGFSFEITRQAKSTLYMYYAGNLAILLYKC